MGRTSWTRLVLAGLATVILAWAGTGEFAKDHLILKVRADFTVQESDGAVETGVPELDALNLRWGMVRAQRVFPEPTNRLARKMEMHRVYVFAADQDFDVQQAVDEYAQVGVVEYAELDYRASADSANPNDPNFNLQWGLKNTGQNPGGSHPGVPGCDIDAVRAWDIERGSHDIVIGILDTGLDLDHPDFVGGSRPSQIWRNVDEIPSNSIDDDGNGYVDDTLGWNFVSGTANTQDDNTHGTHVGGIAGARTNNSTGVAGTSWYCQLMAVKVLDATKHGDWPWICSGIYYAVNNGCRVINMSLGGTSPPTALETAVNYAWNSGALVVASMGNENSGTPRYPAAYDNAFAVGMTDNDDDRVVPGHNGSGSYGSNYGSWIDVMAPGNWIYSTKWNNTYGYMLGTSMAAPFVSGAAALLLGRNPDLTNQDLRDVLESTAEDLGDPGFDIYYGHGRINAYFALQEVDFLPGWKAEAQIRNSTGGSHEADIAVEGQYIHVVFTDRTNSPYGGVYHLRSTDGGQTFSSGQMLSAYQSNYFYCCPSVAVSGSNVHVVFADERNGDLRICYKRSTDSGVSWGGDVFLSNAGVDSYTPDVCAVGNTVHVVWDGGYRKSTNSGASWQSINSSVVGEAIAASGSYVYVAGSEDVTGTDSVFFRRYNGSSWQAPVYLSSGTEALWPDIAADGANVHVVWMQDTDNDLWPEDVYYRRSTNYGGGWLSTKRMTEVGEYQGFAYPRVAAGNNQVHLAWQGDRDGFMEHEIYYQNSTDNGANWGWCKRLCYESGSDELAAIAAWGDTVHVVWDRLVTTKSLYYIRKPAGPPPAHDVGITAILAPTGEYDTSETVAPQATVENFGDDAVVFTPWFVIDGPGDAEVYRESLPPVTLTSGAGQLLEFPAWAKPHEEGQYATLCSLAVSDDNQANDTMHGSFRVTGNPSGPGGWDDDLTPVPDTPSNKTVKQGGWLAYDGSTDNGLVYAAKGYKTTDFYAFDPGAGSWQTLAGMPYSSHPNEKWAKKPPYKGSKGVQVGDVIYVTQGNNTLGFWSYHVNGNYWQVEEDVPAGDGKRVKGGTDLTYVTGSGSHPGYVYLLKGNKREFHRFDLETRTWDSPRAPIPLGSKDKVDKGSWIVYNQGEGGEKLIYGFKSKYHELYAYDVDANSWSAELVKMPLEGWHSGKRKEKKAKDGGCACFYNGAIYAAKGGNTQQFWKYSTQTNSWLELDSIPTTSKSESGKRKRVKYGADLVHHGGGVFYLLRGNKTRDVLRFGAETAFQAGKPGREGVMAEGSSGTVPVGIRLTPNLLAQGDAMLHYSVAKPGPARVRVLDAAGRVVADERLVVRRTGTARLDLSQLSSGMYLVRFDTDGMRTAAKLVVKR